MRTLPPANKRRIGFVIDDDRARLELDVTICDRSEFHDTGLFQNIRVQSQRKGC